MTKQESNTQWDVQPYFNSAVVEMMSVKFPRALKVSVAIHNALCDCVELCRKYQKHDRFGIGMLIGVKGYCRKSVMLFLDGYMIALTDEITSSEYERLKQYYNFQLLDISTFEGSTISEIEIDTDELDFAERFLTDYILFINPDAKVEDIIATIVFDCYVAHLKVAPPEDYKVYRIDYLSDGSTRSDKSWDECVDLLLKTIENDRHGNCQENRIR